MGNNLPWSVYEFKIIQNWNDIEYKLTEKKNQWLCNFTFLTSPWPITSRSSKVVCERIKLHRTDVISLIMHALKRYPWKSVQEKTTTQTNQTSGSCRDRKKVSCFLWIYLAGYEDNSSPVEHEPTGQKPKSTHQDESKLCSLFSSLCTSKCTHHTNSHVSSADCSQSSNSP